MSHTGSKIYIFMSLTLELRLSRLLDMYVTYGSRIIFQVCQFLACFHLHFLAGMIMIDSQNSEKSIRWIWNAWIFHDF